jgi:ribokinase
MSSRAVVTVGSIHIDLVAYTTRRPHVGETFQGVDFTVSTGGKGANQAIQAALSGAPSYLVARMGDDLFAPLIRATLAGAGVDTTYVSPDAAGTGVGHVLVDGDGDYTAVIIPRANANLGSADLERAAPAFAQAGVLLLQLEVPLDVTLFAAQTARRIGITVFLNAAPVIPLPAALLDSVDVLVLNEIEAEMLTGVPRGEPLASARRALDALHRRVPNVVISLGALGVIAVDAAGRRSYLPAHRVPVVNTIGAGDAFIGELAARMAAGASLFDALPFANAAGALAVTQATSQGLRPDRARIAAMAAAVEAIVLEGEEATDEIPTSVTTGF